MTWWRSRRATPLLATAVLTVPLLLSADPASAAAAWRIVPSPNVGTQNQLASATALAPGNVWAVGQNYSGNSTYAPLVQHFNGTSWQVVPSPAPANGRQNHLGGISAASASDIWSVGWSLTSRSHISPLVEHYNGSTWSLVPAPGTLQRTLLSDTAALSASDVWAVGGQSDASSNGPALVEHYNGSAWSVVPTPVTVNSLLLSMTAVSATDLWAVGQQMPAGASSQAGLAMHYNGTGWTTAAVPAPALQPGDVWQLTQVSASSARDVWAIGQLDRADDTGQPFLEHFDGTAWSLVPAPHLVPAASYSRLDTLIALAPGNLWVIGNGTTSGGQAEKLLEHFDGTTWTLAGTLARGTDSLQFNALTSPGGGQLWAVGSSVAPSTANFQTLTALYP